MLVCSAVACGSHTHVAPAPSSGESSASTVTTATPPPPPSAIADRIPTPPSGKCMGDAECDFGLFTQPMVTCEMSAPSSKDCPFMCVEQACAPNPAWNHTGGKCKTDADCHPPYAHWPMTCSNATHVCEGFSLPAWGLVSPTPPSPRCSTTTECNLDLFAHPEVQCGVNGSPEDCPFTCKSNGCANNPGWNHKGGTCTTDSDCHPRDPKRKMVCSAAMHVCEVAKK